jgi:AraC family transcriptional regulator
MQHQNPAHLLDPVANSPVPSSNPAPSRPESGVKSYDRAIWSKWLPEARQAVRVGEVGSVLQLVSPDVAGTTEIIAPAATSSALLFWMQGQKVCCKLDGGGHEFRALPWQFTLVPGGCRSWWVGGSKDLGHVFHLHLDASLLDRVADEQLLPGGAAALAPRARMSDPVVSQLATWLLEDTTDLTRPTRLLMDTIGAAVALRLMCPPSRPVRAATRGLAPWQIRRVQDFLEAHLAEDVTLQSLADLIGTSTFHLCRAFKQSTGLPPHRRLVSRRMEQAARLLIETNWRISHVAAEVGYADASAFASAFRKHQHHSPSDYRRLRRR